MKHTGIMIATRGETTIVSISGWIVLGIGSELLRETLGRAASSSTRRIIVDVRNVTKLDAAGLGVIAFFHGTYRSARICLRVVEPSSLIEEMFRRARLTGLLAAAHEFALPEVAQ